MKMPTTPEVRNELIAQLRNAVRTQIEFWDFTAVVADMLDVEPEHVVQFCQEAAIHADTGMELEENDLRVLLDWVGALDAKD
jgi:hypothetical protein